MKKEPFDFGEQLSRNCKSIRSSFLREILDKAAAPDLISFAGGLPNPGLFPLEEITESLTRVMQDNPKKLLQYSGSQGHLPLREWISARYFSRYNISIDPGDIVITNGSQQALDLCGKMFINPGDPVLMEKPSYIGAIQAFSAYQAHMIQVEQQDDGINTCQLWAEIEKQKPAFLYTIPNFQNPSGITYSDTKKAETSEVLIKCGVPLLEDDPYSEIWFDKMPSQPISFSMRDQAILTGSFSKMIAPGIRTGWMVVPPKLKPWLMKAKQACDLHTNNLVQYLITDFLQQNSIDHHLQKIRKHYRTQKEAMTEAARKYLGNEVKLTDPQGGMFVWATLPEGINTMELIDQALNSGILFVPGAPFFIEDEGKNCMRLNFTNSTPEEIDKGMQKLALILTACYTL